MDIDLLRRTRERGWNPKVACALTLALFFLSGGLAGALVMDMGVHNRTRAPSFDTASGRTLVFERLQKELDLSPAQSEQIKSVLNDFWQYYRTVLSDSRSRVEQLLTAEQKKKFERLLQERQRP